MFGLGLNHVLDLHSVELRIGGMSEQRPACAGCGQRQWIGQPPSCGNCGLPLTLDVVALEEDDLPTLEVSLAPAVESLTTTHRMGHATGSQRLVFALLASALQEGQRHDRLTILISYTLVPILLLLGVFCSLFLMVGFWWLCSLVDLGAGKSQNLEYLLYAVPVFLFLTARVMKSTAESARIDLDFVDNRIEGFRLGRLRDIFHSGAPGTLALFLGLRICNKLPD
jgi:hypothetical protein